MRSSSGFQNWLCFAALLVFGPAFSFSQDILGAVGDAALGVLNTSQWSKDIDNSAKKAFVADFQTEYCRLPSLYASQGFDAANLILSALDKAEPGDADAFRAALRAADFDSVRDEVAFAANQHPIQDIYVREVVAGDGKPTNRLVGTAIEDHQDAYFGDCSM